MSATPNQQSTVITQGGFSLAALGTLITVVATLLASADAERWQHQYAWLVSHGSWTLPALFGGAALVGGLIGLVHLLVDGFRWRTLLAAPLSGALAGCIGVLILVAPGPLWRSLASIVVLLVATNLLRLGAE
jgi:hypothetical protein